MSTSNKTIDEINQVMLNAFMKLQTLVDNDLSQKDNFLLIVQKFLLGIVSTVVDLVEVSLPGSAPLIYADVEAAAKLGGLRAIVKWSSDYGSPHYSVSNITEHDMTAAMNYMGQQLTTALFKGLHELPLPLRNQEMLLRSVEALLANLLKQKFDDPHRILDSFCDHVHMALNDVELRKVN